MAVQRNNVVVIGLGSFGEALARDLTMIGDRVLGIDSDAAIVSRFADELDAVIQTDACDLKSLSECALNNYDAVVVSIGENTEASIIASMNALKLGCGNVWVKAQSETHHQILEAIGIDRVIEPEGEYGRRIAQIIHNPKLLDYLSLGDDQYVAHVELPEKYVGTTIEKLQLRDKFSLTCVGIWRDNKMIAEDFFKEKLQAEDSLLLSGRPRDLRRFADR